MYKTILEEEDVEKLEDECVPTSTSLVPIHNSTSNNNNNNHNNSVHVENGAPGNNKVEPTKKRMVKNDTYFSIASQVVFPYMVAGVGMVFAGLYLHNVQVSAYTLERKIEISFELLDSGLTSTLRFTFLLETCLITFSTYNN